MSLDVLVGSIKSSLPSHALVKVRHSHFFCGYKKASKDSCLVNGIKLDTDTAQICVSSQLSQFKCQMIHEHDEKITWAVLLASTPRSPTTPTSIAITPSKLCTGLSALSLPPSFQSNCHKVYYSGETLPPRQPGGDWVGMSRSKLLSQQQAGEGGW